MIFVCPSTESRCERSYQDTCLFDFAKDYKDPVHYNETATRRFPDEPESKDNRVEAPGWYFWDETWADRSGPYETEKEARAQLTRYYAYLNGDQRPASSSVAAFSITTVAACLIALILIWLFDRLVN